MLCFTVLSILLSPSGQKSNDGHSERRPDHSSDDQSAGSLTKQMRITRVQALEPLDLAHPRSLKEVDVWGLSCRTRLAHATYVLDESSDSWRPECATWNVSCQPYSLVVPALRKLACGATTYFCVRCM